MSSSGPDVTDGGTGGIGGGTVPADDGQSFIEKLRQSLPVDAIRKFFGNPAAFILGAVLGFFVTAIETAIQLLIGLILQVLGGSVPFGSPPGETPIGIADIPVVIVRFLLLPFGVLGGTIRDTIALFGNAVTDVAAVAGPAAPLVTFALWAMTFFGVAWGTWTVGMVVLEVVPGGSVVLVVARQSWSLVRRIVSALSIGGDG